VREQAGERDAGGVAKGEGAGRRSPSEALRLAAGEQGSLSHTHSLSLTLLLSFLLPSAQKDSSNHGN